MISVLPMSKLYISFSMNVQCFHWTTWIKHVWKTSIQWIINLCIFTVTLFKFTNFKESFCKIFLGYQPWSSIQILITRFNSTFITWLPFIEHEFHADAETSGDVKFSSRDRKREFSACDGRGGMIEPPRVVSPGVAVMTRRCCVTYHYLWSVTAQQASLQLLIESCLHVT